MKKFSAFGTSLLAIAAFSLLATADEPPAQTSPSTMEPVRLLDQRAMSTLKSMSDYLKSLKSFSFATESEFDVVEGDGQKLQFSRDMTVKVRRPDRLTALATGSGADKSYFYDGKSVVILDKEAKVYSRVPAPAKIGDMLDQMSDYYGLSVPTGDFLYDDVYETLTEYVDQARYVGEATLRGTKCHHLAFRQQAVDWQVWIATGDKPLPHKLVVTYKDDATCPQYVARFTDWQPNANFDDKTFVFVKTDDQIEAPMSRIDNGDQQAESASDSDER